MMARTVNGQRYRILTNGSVYHVEVKQGWFFWSKVTDKTVHTITGRVEKETPSIFETVDDADEWINDHARTNGKFYDIDTPKKTLRVWWPVCIAALLALTACDDGGTTVSVPGDNNTVIVDGGDNQPLPEPDPPAEPEPEPMPAPLAESKDVAIVPEVQAAEPPPPEPLRVLIAGQSNICDREPYTGSADVTDLDGDPLGMFSKVGVAFAAELFWRTGIPVRAADACRGGSSVERFAPGGDLHHYFTRHDGVPFDYVLWWQGESDAHAPELYADRLRSLIAATREYAAWDALPWVIVGLERYCAATKITPDCPEPASHTATRAAQVAVADADPYTQILDISPWTNGDYHPWWAYELVGCLAAALAIDKDANPCVFKGN